MNKRKKISLAIIGYGRFGRLLAEILSPYAQINIISRTKIKTKAIKQIDYKDLEKIDWVIPAVPISSLEETLDKISPHLKPGSLVMDVCSVKVNPCRWLKKHLPRNVELLGSHPMFGPDSAKKGLKNLQIIFCPIRIKQKKYLEIKSIFKKLKLKIIETTPANHDKQNALSLALVHFIGRGFEKLTEQKVDITTLGYKRLLQVGENVSNDSWQLYLDINNFNPYSKGVREKFIESLQNIDSILKSNILEKSNSIPTLRGEINKIDNKIFSLVGERQKIVKQIGVLKHKRNLPIINSSREKELIKKIVLSHNLDKDFVEALYKIIFKQSYKSERL